MPRFMICNDMTYYPSIDGCVEAENAEAALAIVVPDMPKVWASEAWYAFPVDGSAAVVGERQVDRRDEEYSNT